MGEVIRLESGTEQMEGADGVEVETHLKTVQVNTVSMSDVALSCQALSLDGHEDDDEDAVQNGGDAQKKLVSVDFEIFGKVQGVFMRKYTGQKGEELGIRGWCKNSSRGGSLIGVLQGESEQVEKMKLWLESSACPKSRVVRLEFRNEHPLMLLPERLQSLQRGMEQFQLTFDRVERRLDEQVGVFDTLRADLEQLEDKVNAVRSANNAKRPHHVAQSMKHDNVTSSSKPTRVQPER